MHERETDIEVIIVSFFSFNGILKLGQRQCNYLRLHMVLQKTFWVTDGILYVFLLFEQNNWCYYIDWVLWCVSIPCDRFFIWCQVALASGEGNFVDTVRNAQLGISLPNVKCVDARGLALESDHLHLTSESQYRVGVRLAEAFIFITS